MKGLSSASSDKRVTKSGHTCAHTIACFPSQLFFKSSWAKVRITEDLTSGLSNGGSLRKKYWQYVFKEMLTGVKDSFLGSPVVLLYSALGLTVVRISNQSKPLEGFSRCSKRMYREHWKNHLKPQVLQIEFITILALILLSIRHCRASVKNIFYLPLLLQNQ